MSLLFGAVVLSVADAILWRMSQQPGHNEATTTGEQGAGLGIHPWRIFAERHPHIAISLWQDLPGGAPAQRCGDVVWLSKRLQSTAARRSALARVLAALEREKTGAACSDPAREAKAADAVAARWLISLEDLAAALAQAIYEGAKIGPRLAELLWCDEKAVADRFADLRKDETNWLVVRAALGRAACPPVRRPPRLREGKGERTRATRSGGPRSRKPRPDAVLPLAQQCARQPADRAFLSEPSGAASPKPAAPRPIPLAVTTRDNDPLVSRRRKREREAPPARRPPEQLS